MIIPEILYRLSSTDAQKVRAEIINLFASGAGSGNGYLTRQTSGTTGQQYVVPPGFICVVPFASMGIEPGATQYLSFAASLNITQVIAGVVNIIGYVIVIGSQGQPVATPLFQSVQNAFIVPPGGSLRVYTQFNSDINPNYWRAIAQGIQIPTGGLLT